MTNEETIINQQKKNFALTLDAVSFILQSLGFYTIKFRALIDALQGAAGGRKEFECSHLNLARRLDLEHGKEVKPEGKQRRVQRMLNVLEIEQKRVGKMIFTVIRGGGFEHKRTQYVDNLTELANWAMRRTQDRMRTENIEPSKFKMILQEESERVALLLPDTPKENCDKKNSSMPLDDSLYIQREMSLSLNAFARALERAIENGGDVKSFVEHHINRVTRRAETVKSQLPENSDKKPLDFSEVVSLACSTENESEMPQTPETDGLQIESSQLNEPNMMQEALDLAEKGFRVFPVYEPTEKGCSCKQGESCTNAGKHPRILEWQKAATTNDEQIINWWDKWKGANIGIATGKASNLIVLDADTGKGGDDSLLELFENTGLPETLAAQTGNGFHLFFESVEELTIKNSVQELGYGLDIRGENGFVVAAPSLHRNGNRYSWMNEANPCSLPEHLKEKLIDIENQRTTQNIASSDSKQLTATDINKSPKKKIPLLIYEHTDKGIGNDGMGNARNGTLCKIGCSMRGKGASLSEISKTLHEVNMRRCVPPMNSWEVEKIAQSVMRYPSEQEKSGMKAGVSV